MHKPVQKAESWNGLPCHSTGLPCRFSKARWPITAKKISNGNCIRPVRSVCPISKSLIRLSSSIASEAGYSTQPLEISRRDKVEALARIEAEIELKRKEHEVSDLKSSCWGNFGISQNQRRTICANPSTVFSISASCLKRNCGMVLIRNISGTYPVQPIRCRPFFAIFWTMLAPKVVPPRKELKLSISMR